MTFYTGQKVVCVAHGDWSRAKKSHMEYFSSVLNVPVSGGIYTIRHLYHTPGEEPGLRLEEVVNNVLFYPNGITAEPGWPRWEFRPLVERKTDISIFQRMLDGVSAH